jgi:hypothetical protein
LHKVFPVPNPLLLAALGGQSFLSLPRLFPRSGYGGHRVGVTIGGR